MYRCRICGTFYERSEIIGSMFSPCCDAVLDPIRMANRISEIETE